MAEGGKHGTADYQLWWPRDLFKREAADLLNQRSATNNWNERCELLLEDAFVSNVPSDDFRAWTSHTPFATNSAPREPHQFLVTLLRRADSFMEYASRTPYWSARRTAPASGQMSDQAVAREFVRLVQHLDDRGYFERAFGKDCVDDHFPGIDPAACIEEEIGVAGLWPLSATRLADSRDVFFDVVEVLHDLVARPRSRWMHQYDACGWHHGDFSLMGGQRVYRPLVNKLFAQAGLGLWLADDGEDSGRLVTVTDPARSDLVHRMAERDDPAFGEVVRHALALFRGRTATEHDKRSAVVSLARVLEHRRDLLKTELLRKDEGALFQIANGFAIRHSSDTQKSDYDPAFLDWIFYWYLATIELTDRLLARQQSA